MLRTAKGNFRAVAVKKKQGEGRANAGLLSRIEGLRQGDHVGLQALLGDIVKAK